MVAYHSIVVREGLFCLPLVSFCVSSVFVSSAEFELDSPDADEHKYTLHIVDQNVLHNRKAPLENDVYVPSQGALLSTTEYIATLFRPFNSERALRSVVNGKNFATNRVRLSLTTLFTLLIPRFCSRFPFV